jgi:hypothetical protein
VTEIRSYRRVFDLERRIYSVDRRRLNPGGIPVRAVLYFLVILTADLVAARLPLFGALPWYLRDVALPCAGATVLSAIRIEGRTFHLAAHALVRHLVGPRRLAGLRRCSVIGERWFPDEVVLLPDGSDSRMRRLRYTGPGAVLVCLEHERRGRATETGTRGLARPGLRPLLTVRELAGARPLSSGEVISLSVGARLRVRSEASGKRRI